MINVFGLLGACALATISAHNVLPRRTLDVPVPYYNVSAHYPANSQTPDYLSGNFDLGSNSYYPFKNPAIVESENDVDYRGFIYNSYTIFKEDSFKVSEGAITYIASNNGVYKPFNSDLVLALGNETDYYCGYYDIMFFNWNSRYNFQWWIRYAFIGSSCVNSDFSFYPLGTMPNWNSNLFNNNGYCYSFAMGFYDTLFSLGSDCFIYNDYRSITLNLSQVAYTHSLDANSDLPIFNDIYVDQDYPTKYINTTGVGLRFYPQTYFCVPSVPNLYRSGYNINSSRQLDSYSANQLSLSLYENNSDSLHDTFTCDYQRTSYGESVAYNQGYNQGKQDGIQIGESEMDNAVQTAYQNGYSQGYSDADNQDSTALSIFTGIINVGLLPVNFFLSILNFEVFGINIGAIVSATLTIAIVVIIIRLITGKKND